MRHRTDPNDSRIGHAYRFPHHPRHRQPDAYVDRLTERNAYPFYDGYAHRNDNPGAQPNVVFTDGARDLAGVDSVPDLRELIARDPSITLSRHLDTFTREWERGVAKRIAEFDRHGSVGGGPVDAEDVGVDGQ